MHEKWIKSGETGQPHWSKILGSTYYITACQTVIPRTQAVQVPTQSIGLGGCPGVTVSLPSEAEACETCRQKVLEQA